jgi:DNA-binding NarL/FixJ family response regulator
MKSPRVLVADDQAIVIEGLRRVLETDFEIVGAVANGQALVVAAGTLQPDIVITDISMPLLNGIEAARQIRKVNRNAKIIFFTIRADVTCAVEALGAGGSAYVLKGSSIAEIREAIREVLAGRTYVTPSIKGAVLKAEMERGGRREQLEGGITRRQREVLQLIAEGRTSKEIAALLNVSLRTIEFHKYRILKALGVRTTADLVQYAIKHGIAS